MKHSKESITKLAKPYQGTDPLMEWHRSKIKSSAKDAFRDADYANPFHICDGDETEYLKNKLSEYLSLLPLALVVGIMVYCVFVFVLGFDGAMR